MIDRKKHVTPKSTTKVARATISIISTYFIFLSYDSFQRAKHKKAGTRDTGRSGLLHPPFHRVIMCHKIPPVARPVSAAYSLLYLRDALVVTSAENQGPVWAADALYLPKCTTS